MSGKASKKKLILDYLAAHRLERVGAPEIRQVQAEVRRLLGVDERITPSYVAKVLRQAGAQVDYENPYVDSALPEPHAARFEGALEFSTLATAEASLRKLDALHRTYRSSGDRTGTRLARALALKGKQRAESLARNPRVKPGKRGEKQEIANWFRVWLESPDLFFDWLELRKQSAEFREQFEAPET